MLPIMKITLEQPDANPMEVPEDSLLLVTWPGRPGKSIRLRDLAMVMGDDDIWFEVERRLMSL